MKYEWCLIIEHVEHVNLITVDAVRSYNWKSPGTSQKIAIIQQLHCIHIPTNNNLTLS